jgi:hypothetical protein
MEITDMIPGGRLDNMEFRIESIDDARKFEEMLNVYLVKFGQHGTINMNIEIGLRLADVFQDCEDHVNGAKIFSSTLDFYINLILTMRDMHDALIICNTVASKWKGDDIRSVDNKELFCLKADFHRCLSSFIMRFRALWDKIMGLFFLIYQYEQYDSYLVAKSRKRFFIKNFKSKSIDMKVMSYITTYLGSFDDKYRTPEAHYSGKIRKWTFKTGGFPKDNPIRVLVEDFYTQFLRNIGLILKVFDDIKPEKNIL